MWLKTGSKQSIMETTNLTVASYLNKQISPIIKTMTVTLNKSEIREM